MKFMQRAAATTSAASPGVSQPEDERPSKRVKREFGSSPQRPQAQSPLFDQKAAQAALDAETAKRAALVERQAEKLGDAHWRLDPAKLPGSDQRKGVPLNIVQVGFSQIDKRDALETTQIETGGPSLRSYRPKTPKKMKADEDGVRIPTLFDGANPLTKLYRVITQVAQTAILTLTPILTRRALLVKLPLGQGQAIRRVGPVTVHRSAKS